jgi:hypothetical protein
VINMLRDLQMALRLMRKNPGTTAVIVMALALGIGVTTSSFITVNALVLQPLPFPGIERVMTVWETIPRMRSERDAVAPANFLDWRRQARSFESLAAYQPWDVNLTGLGEPVRAQACLVSPAYFAVVGRKPLLGRVFREDEGEPRRHARRFGPNGQPERPILRHCGRDAFGYRFSARHGYLGAAGHDARAEERPVHP